MKKIFSLLLVTMTITFLSPLSSLAKEFSWPMFLPGITANGPPPVTVISAGQIWMDRNLGATRPATSPTDTEAFGDLYQWGRPMDGHEMRTSQTTLQLSTTNIPGHENFILSIIAPFDWRTPQNNNLWQMTSGTNNPCPSGFRLPTVEEFEIERSSWKSEDAAGAFASPLKLTLAGIRIQSNGTIVNAGSFGYYWSRTVSGTKSNALTIQSGGTFLGSANRGAGFSVRCIKD